ncbi:hypothetical protein GCM10017562_58830 [Streptomyces roseofulvus]
MPAALASASTLATAPPCPTATGTFAGGAAGGGPVGAGGAAAPTESTVAAAAAIIPYRQADRRIPDLPSTLRHPP